jgi:hypothetical protein
MVEDSKRKLADALNTSLADDGAQALRERAATEIPRHLTENGHRLAIHHWLGADAAATAFATATEMAAELSEGARQLFEAGLWYPGIVLVRQLIECHYLLTLMADDREEAKAWMTSSRDEIVARFMPRHMRQRATRNFRLSEYQTHCDLGGHPNPTGRSLLRHHMGSRILSPRCHWVDLAQHLAETWSSFVAGLRLYDPRMDPNDRLYSPQRSPEGSGLINELLAEWRARDPAAHRSTVPDLA